MRQFLKHIVPFIGVFLIALMGCEKKEAAKAVEFEPYVYVTKAEEKTIPIAAESVGHFKAYNSAEIKPQVEGRLLQMHFCEGTDVKAGQLLFTIDPRPYEAELEQAIARRAQDYAAYSYAKERVTRYQVLLPESYVSELEYIQYQTELDNFTAALAKDDADINLANINLDYCYIKAPFNGTTGKKLVDIGNLVTNNGDTLILINQIDPIYVDFAIPERDFFRLVHFQNQQDLNVDFTFAGYPEYKFEAKLVVIGNEIDRMTGTIPLRAEIQNPTKLFWPGQFLRCQVIFRYKENAVVIPKSAVNIGQKGRYVYVIGKENKAKYRSVEVGQSIGDEVEIVKGIRPGDTVVTEGQINLSNNTVVKIRQQEEKGSGESL